MPLVSITRLRVRSWLYLPCSSSRHFEWLVKRRPPTATLDKTAAGSPERVLDWHELVGRGLDESLHALGGAWAGHAKVA